MIFCCGVSSITPERSVITDSDQPAWFSCQGAAPTIIKTNYCCWWGKMFTCITLLCWLAVQGGDSFYFRPGAILISPLISRNAIIGNYKLLLDPPCLMETDEPEFVGNTYHMISQLSHDIEILTEYWPIHNIMAALFISLSSLTYHRICKAYPRRNKNYSGLMRSSGWEKQEYLDQAGPGNTAVTADHRLVRTDLIVATVCTTTTTHHS